MRKKWLMIPLATGLLAAGLTGTSVLAHNEDGEQESPKDTVASKVAGILGLDAESVKEALQEATREVHSERIQHRLEHMVEAGRLTEEQAASYLEWYQSRPEGPSLHRGGHRMFGSGGGAEGENNGPVHRFGGRGQGNGDRGFPGFSQTPSEDRSFSGFNQLPDGREFPGQGGRSNGRRFLGRGNAPSAQEAPTLGGDVPGAGGTSF